MDSDILLMGGSFVNLTFHELSSWICWIFIEKGAYGYFLQSLTEGCNV